MPNLPKSRRTKTSKTRNKVVFKKDGTVNKKARVAFYDAQKEHHDLYNKQYWQRIRKVVLNDYPICPVCEAQGRIEPTSDIDHVVAHKGDEQLFRSLDNLWGLCRHHHVLKTAAESNGVHFDTKEEWLKHLLK